jgi:hypothetical protein
MLRYIGYLNIATYGQRSEKLLITSAAGTFHKEYQCCW